MLSRPEASLSHRRSRSTETIIDPRIPSPAYFAAAPPTTVSPFPSLCGEPMHDAGEKETPPSDRHVVVRKPLLPAPCVRSALSYSVRAPRTSLQDPGSIRRVARTRVSAALDLVGDAPVIFVTIRFSRPIVARGGSAINRSLARSSAAVGSRARFYLAGEELFVGDKMCEC